MTMRVVVFGGSGMIGEAVVLQALDSPRVQSVLSVGRNALEVDHPKLRQIAHRDFEDFGPIADDLAGLDACFWCLGTASAGVDEPAYRRITKDFTMAAATVLHEGNPELTFCFLSGAGAGTNSRMMWARVKAETEEALGAVGFGRLIVFRPAFIQPLRGRRAMGSALRAATALPFALARAVGGASSNTAIGDAMIAAAAGMSDQGVLGSGDINRLAARLADAPVSDVPEQP